VKELPCYVKAGESCWHRNLVEFQLHTNLEFPTSLSKMYMHCWLDLPFHDLTSCV